jgi:hypothetical protein
MKEGIFSDHSDLTFTKIVVRQGQSEQYVREGDVCTIICNDLNRSSLKLSDVMIGFDLDKPVDLKVGWFKTGVQRFVSRALGTMRLSEVCELSFELDPDGSACSTFDCKFRIELTDIDRTERVPSLLNINADNVQSFIDLIKSHKAEANLLFTANRAIVSFYRYNTAIRYLIIVEDSLKAMAEHHKTEYKPIVEALKSQLYLNIAACQLKYSKKNAENIVQNCTKCINLNQSLVKAYYRRSQAYCLMNEFESARKDLESALKLETSDKQYFIGKITEVDRKRLELIESRRSVKESLP